MKKSILILTGAMLLLAGCAKVENEIVPETGKRIVTLKATVDESNTRVSVNDDGYYSWQADDKIAVMVTDGTDQWCVQSKNNSDPGETASFPVSLNEGEELGQYAFYPYGESSGIYEGDVYFGLRATQDYVKGATLMPMLGTITSTGVSFKSVGGVLQLTINNIPKDAACLRFSANDTKICGEFVVTDGIITVEDSEMEDCVTIDFEGHREDNMVFYIPLPTGTINGFTLSFLDMWWTEIEGTTKTTSATLNVGRNQIIVAPTLTFSPNIKDYVSFSEETLNYFPELDTNQPVIRYYNNGSNPSYPFSFESDYDWNVSVSYVNDNNPWLNYDTDAGSLAASSYVWYERTATMIFTCDELDLSIKIPIEEHFFVTIKQGEAVMNGGVFELLVGQSAIFTAEVDIPQWMTFEGMSWNHFEGDGYNNITIVPDEDDDLKCLVTGREEGTNDFIWFRLYLSDKKTGESEFYDASCRVPVVPYHVPLMVNGFDVRSLEVSIPLGETITMTADISGIEGEIQSVSFVSEDGILDITRDGYSAEVTGVSLGYGQIELQVKLQDGTEYSTRCDIGVVPITMTLNGVPISGPITLAPGQSVSLTASLMGIDAESVVRVSWGLENGDWDYDTDEYLEGSGPFVNLFYDHDNLYTVTLTARKTPAGHMDTVWFMIMLGEEDGYVFQIPVFLSE